MPGVSKCVVITGLSGAGKSTALRVLEDRGFYACDNLPPALLPSLAELLASNRAAASSGIAVVIDVRGEGFFSDLAAAVASLAANDVVVKVVFLEACDEVLIRRYETTRRTHPLGEGATISEGVALERGQMTSVRDMSDIVIDTSDMTSMQLRSALLGELGVDDEPLSVVVSSFGFKYGTPGDCDYLFDVRFLPNPNYVPELKALSGRDREVQAYLDEAPAKDQFIGRVVELFDFLLPQYDAIGKKYVHIAFGCTGGRHRSVALAEAVSRALIEHGCRVTTKHRDISKDGE